MPRLVRPTVSALDPFLPRFDVRERHEKRVSAPAEVAFEAARTLDLQSIPLIHAIFWLRGRLLGAKAPADPARGLDAEGLRAMGWGTLREIPGRLLVCGAVCQPWLPDVVFTPIAPELFADYTEPDRVKIAWTIETEPVDPDASRFATETRAVATEASARKKFRRYWRFAGIGIVAIRWLLVPAVRRRAERLWRERAR